MQATRRYYSSILSSLSMLSLFLVGFIIFGILLGTLAAGQGRFNAAQMEVTNTTYSTVLANATLANGTTYTYNFTSPSTTSHYVNDCNGNECSWWLYRLVLLLAVCALALFVLGFAFAAFAIAVFESDHIRSNVAQTGSYGMLEVVRPPFTYLAAVLCDVLAIWFIFAAVIIVIDSVAGRHSWVFIASIIILCAFALIMGLLLLFTIFKTEAPIQVQPVYATVPVQTNAALPGHRLSIHNV